MGETMARSLRISNRKLKGEFNWRPKYPSPYDGWPMVLAAIESAKPVAAPTK